VGFTALGVSRIGLFGSLVRGEQYPDCDSDLLVEFEAGPKTFDAFTPPGPGAAYGRVGDRLCVETPPARFSGDIAPDAAFRSRQPEGPQKTLRLVKKLSGKN
jgi:Nucleotidyltransferase domain